MSLSFAPSEAPALPLHLCRPDDLDATLAALPAKQRAWVVAQGFRARPATVVVLPDPAGGIAGALAGRPDDAARRRTRFASARIAASLPPGDWRLVTDLPADERDEMALGWLLSAYRFDRYRSGPSAPAARLVVPAGCDAALIERLARAEALTRDLVNTPANDLGPQELEDAVRRLADAHGAEVAVTCGDALLAANLPLVHAVGRAASRAPRLIDLRHGTRGPCLTLVGKGVCFDTGGLNLKPGASMGLMKKDMGGAAAVLGLAQMILEAGWPVRLRVLIPAVENSVSAPAFRPGDILTSRKGLTVEVNNTDAEGRLILADALALAAEEAPDMLVSMATLTGAARTALGPDVVPFYCDDDPASAALAEGARIGWDPVWRMPFWDPYEEMIEPGIADLDNAPSGGMAGSIVAALFLRRFAAGARRYVHFDIYGWQPSAAPGRAKGGLGQGARALYFALPRVLGL